MNNNYKVVYSDLKPISLYLSCSSVSGWPVYLSTCYRTHPAMAQLVSQVDTECPSVETLQASYRCSTQWTVPRKLEGLLGKVAGMAVGHLTASCATRNFARSRAGGIGTSNE